MAVEIQQISCPQITTHLTQNAVLVEEVDEGVGEVVGGDLEEDDQTRDPTIEAILPVVRVMARQAIIVPPSMEGAANRLLVCLQ